MAVTSEPLHADSPPICSQVQMWQRPHSPNPGALVMGSHCSQDDTKLYSAAHGTPPSASFVLSTPATLSLVLPHFLLPGMFFPLAPLYSPPPHLHCHMLLRKVCLTFAVTGSYSTHTCFSFRSLGAATTLQLLVQLRLTLICLSNHVSLVLLMLRIEPLVLSTPWMLEKYLWSVWMGDWRSGWVGGGTLAQPHQRFVPLWSVPLHFLHLPCTRIRPTDQQKHLLGLGICNRTWADFIYANMSFAHRSKNQASLLINTLPYWNSFKRGLHNLPGLLPIFSRITPWQMIGYTAFMEEVVRS